MEEVAEDQGDQHADNDKEYSRIAKMEMKERVPDDGMDEINRVARHTQCGEDPVRKTFKTKGGLIESKTDEDGGDGEDHPWYAGDNIDRGGIKEQKCQTGSQKERADYRGDRFVTEEIAHEKTGQEQEKLIQRIDIIEPLVEIGYGGVEPTKGKIKIDNKDDAGEQVKGEPAFFEKDDKDREEQVEDQFVADRPGSRGDVSVAVDDGEKPCQVIEQPGIRWDDIADEHGQEGNQPKQGENPDEPAEKIIADTLPVGLHPVKIDQVERQSAEYIQDRYAIYSVTAW